jgi:hypothetical protein
MNVEKDRHGYLSAPTVQAFLREHWVLIVILGIGIAVRLYEFGSYPLGSSRTRPRLVTTPSPYSTMESISTVFTTQ